jgi:hypothetical protein
VDFRSTVLGQIVPVILYNYSSWRKVSVKAALSPTFFVKPIMYSFEQPGVYAFTSEKLPVRLQTWGRYCCSLVYVRCYPATYKNRCSTLWAWSRRPAAKLHPPFHSGSKGSLDRNNLGSNSRHPCNRRTGLYFDDGKILGLDVKSVSVSVVPVIVMFLCHNPAEVSCARMVKLQTDVAWRL